MSALTRTLALLLVLLPSAAATTRLGIDLGRIEGAGWQADGVALAIEMLDPAQAVLRLTADSIRLPEPVGRVGGIQIECPRARIDADAVHCGRGRLRFSHPRLGAQRVELGFDYRTRGASELRMEGLRLGDGKLDLHARAGEGAWEVALDVRRLPLQRIAELLEGLAPLPELELSGSGDLQARLSGAGPALDVLELRAELGDLVFSDAEGTRVGQDLDLRLDLSVARDSGQWVGDVGLRLSDGELYVEPVYLEVPEGALSLGVSGAWDPGASALGIDSFELDHGGMIRAAGRLALTFDPEIVPRSADLELHKADLPTLYTSYLQPFLIGSAVDDLETAGELAGTVRIRDGRIQRLDAMLSEIYADDRRGRFGVYDVDADLRWRDDTIPVRSELRLAGGHVLGLDLGSAALRFDATADSIVLAEPTALPLLDGELNIAELAIEGIGTGSLTWGFDAGVTPISMERLTHALGWPILSGKLSGMIPDVRYAEGTLTVGGALLARAFGGAITVHQLRLQDPLGVVPRLSADIVLQDLDLERLTRRFDFGQITGLLGGEVRDLRLVAWKPVSFDARLGTPKGDRSRHRISQRALDNLTNLGSGVSGVLSTGFLSLFEDFAYDEIGLSCRLRDGVCDMDGVGKAETGYYIVRGRGLPRVDVIGYNRRVAWEVLIGRLRDRLERPSDVQ
jgi:hypothetical protein